MEIDGVGVTDAQPLEFAQHCATSKELRDASVSSEKRLSDFHVEMTMRKDVFDNVKAFKVSIWRIRLKKFGLEIGVCCKFLMGIISIVNEI